MQSCSASQAAAGGPVLVLESSVVIGHRIERNSTTRRFPWSSRAMTWTQQAERLNQRQLFPKNSCGSEACSALPLICTSRLFPAPVPRRQKVIDDRSGLIRDVVRESTSEKGRRSLHSRLRVFDSSWSRPPGLWPSPQTPTLSVSCDVVRHQNVTTPRMPNSTEGSTASRAGVMY